MVHSTEDWARRCEDVTELLIAFERAEGATELRIVFERAEGWHSFAGVAEAAVAPPTTRIPVRTSRQARRMA